MGCRCRLTIYTNSIFFYVQTQVLTSHSKCIHLCIQEMHWVSLLASLLLLASLSITLTTSKEHKEPVTNEEPSGETVHASADTPTAYLLATKAVDAAALFEGHEVHILYTVYNIGDRCSPYSFPVPPPYKRPYVHHPLRYQLRYQLRFSLRSLPLETSCAKSTSCN